MMPAHKFLKLPADATTPRCEEEFFSSIMGRNGTYKTTFRQRFSEVDDALVSLLESRAITAGSILDIGISSGTSTVELYDKLLSNGYETAIVGTDILLDANIIRVFPGCRAIVDETGFPLRFDLMKWSIKPWVVKSDYYNGMAIIRKSINRLFGYKARRMLQKLDHPSVEGVKLVTPRLLGNEHIQVFNDDIRVYNRGYFRRFDFIRAANIFNVNYFPERDLRAMLGNVKRYLAGAGSSFLVLRTHEDKTNHGALYRLNQDDAFEQVRRFGNGSEVDGLVMGAGSGRRMA